MQLITILSGLLPDPEVQVSAMTICFNTAALCFMLPLGLSTAVRSADRSSALLLQFVLLSITPTHFTMTLRT